MRYWLWPMAFAIGSKTMAIWPKGKAKPRPSGQPLNANSKED